MTTRHRNHHDGPLHTATLALETAVLALSGPRTHCGAAGRTLHLESRLAELYGALIDRTVSSQRRSDPATQAPAWIDALKLKHTIQHRVAELATAVIHADPPPRTTIARLDRIRTHHYRPQDTRNVESAAAELQSFVIAIDDLFAIKPVILYNPHNRHEWATCPRCGYNDAHRHTDDGQIIRTPALLLTVERGAWCTHCHDTWKGETQVRTLAAMLNQPGAVA